MSFGAALSLPDLSGVALQSPVVNVRRLVAILVVLAGLGAASACVPAPGLAGTATAAPPPATASPSPDPSPVVPRVGLLSPRSTWLGSAVRLAVEVTPLLPGANVVVERLDGDVWVPVAEGALDEASRAEFRWRPETYGRTRLRATLPAGAGHEAATSESRRLVVNRPNAHRVPYRFAHYIVMVVHEYRLYYYEHGELVRRFDVALGRPGYPTPIGTFRIYGKRRPGGGALGSCAMFYRRAGGIAIHGTDQPWLLGRFPRPFSHGCARMHNREALWLYERVPVGTTVRNIR